jgi:hypothetical protein
MQTQYDSAVVPLNENELPNLRASVDKNQPDSDHPGNGSLTNEKSDSKRGNIEITLGNKPNSPRIQDQDSGDNLIIQPNNSILSP